MVAKMETLRLIKRCPVEVTLHKVGRKWAVNILRDIFQGKSRFSDFLKANPLLSTKTLSLRLRELMEAELIDKVIKSKTPILVEYHLTEKGRAFGHVIKELAIFSIRQNPTEVFEEVPESVEVAIDQAKRWFTP